mmetsp:Transcript_153575/g.268548  ORF Transcript_153575/g.268548 Transcript_153575/m.268548 type:complete len:233 (-) Transcript_153575:118-816(-)
MLVGIHQGGNALPGVVVAVILLSGPLQGHVRQQVQLFAVVLEGLAAVDVGQGQEAGGGRPREEVVQHVQRVDDGVPDLHAVGHPAGVHEEQGPEGLELLEQGAELLHIVHRPHCKLDLGDVRTQLHLSLLTHGLVQRGLPNEEGDDTRSHLPAAVLVGRGRGVKQIQDLVLDRLQPVFDVGDVGAGAIEVRVLEVLLVKLQHQLLQVLCGGCQDGADDAVRDVLHVHQLLPQ